MSKDKNRRKHQRHAVEPINPVRLCSTTGEIFYVVPVDESEGGMGCIFSGKNPPQTGHTYLVGEENDTRPMEVRWVESIGNNRFRLGLRHQGF